MRQYCQGVYTWKIYRVWMKKKKTLDGIRFNQPATSLAIRHMAANSNSCCSKNTGREQQQQRQQQHAVCINTCQAHNTSYNIIIPGISGPPKKRTRWKWNHHGEILNALILPVHPLRFLRCRTGSNGAFWTPKTKPKNKGEDDIERFTPSD